MSEDKSSSSSAEEDFEFTHDLIEQSMANWECSEEEATDRLVEALNWQRSQRGKPYPTYIPPGPPLQLKEHNDLFVIDGVEVDGKAVPITIPKAICPPTDDAVALKIWLMEAVRGAIASGGDKGHKHGRHWPDGKRWVWMFRDVHQDGSITITEAPANG